MTEEQRARMEYLREDLKIWEGRRDRARWSLPLDRIYNCTAMDKELGAMQRELHDLELLVEEPRKKRRPRET